METNTTCSDSTNLKSCWEVSDMKKKDKAPQIRFKGYTDDWEQRKLGEVLTSLQNNTLSRADLSSEQGIAKNVHYGDILVKFGEVIDVKTESLPMIADEAVIAKYKSSFLQNGDVIVADTAEDETVGKCTEIAGLGDEIVISGLHTIPYRPVRKFASGYLGYYMNSVSFHNQLLPLMQGIKVTSISKTALQNTDIIYPKSATEQEAIGKYFCQLDHLITLHQRKYDKFVNIKKSMLEKMFPKRGAKVPEIRFKGYTDDWEQRKVTELGEIYIGLVTTMTAHYTDKGALLIRNSDIRDGYFEFGDNPIYLDEEFVEQNSSRKHQVGDVITVHTGDIGTSAVITENEAGSIGFATIVTRPDTKKIIPKYLCAYLNTDTHKRFAMRISTGDGRNNYNLKDYYNCVVPFPNLEEQRKISDYIQSINHLITLHQRKLEKLRNIKKACLEKMFV